MTKIIGTSENFKLLRKLLLFLLPAYLAVILNDSLLKKSKIFIRKMKKKNNRFEKS